MASGSANHNVTDDSEEVEARAGVHKILNFLFGLMLQNWELGGWEASIYH